MAYTTIDDPSAYFQTLLYTGDGNDDRNLVNTGNSDLQPDWIWNKRRDSTSNHFIFDSSRGTSKIIATDSDEAEGTNANQLQAFQTDGFQLGSDNGSNGSSRTMVAWQWKCNGGTTSSFTESGNNPGGTIQTNTTAGFSIITTTGTGATGTIAHGLGAVPHWWISKQRSNAEHWAVYHVSNTSAPETEILTLNNTDATADNANAYNDTAPTSTNLTVHTKNEVNTDARTYVHYVFTPIQGYSKFGGYIGNNNADGTFVYTGFKPALLILKNIDDAVDWYIFDNKRDTDNVVQNIMHPNKTDAASDSAVCDFLSNGFKFRTADNAWNGNGDSYIYMAFAEHPFVSSKGVPTTAR